MGGGVVLRALLKKKGIRRSMDQLTKTFILFPRFHEENDDNEDFLPFFSPLNGPQITEDEEPKRNEISAPEIEI